MFKAFYKVPEKAPGIHLFINHKKYDHEKSPGKFFALMAVLFTISLSASAQIYVKIRPPMPHIQVVRPPQPSPVHIWVNEDWKRDGSSYRYSGGYWANPPHKNQRWVPGHWQRSNHGERWVPGRWGYGKKKH